MANLDAWKSFITGRVSIEKGDVAGGLAAINEALKLDPSEPIFVRSRETAETLLRASAKEAIGTELASEYNRIAKANSGANDKPDVWLRDLHNLLDKAEGRVSAVAVVW
ncbi:MULTISPECIES: hypothetical protein [unclassified Bradyrhizobium]|uniref:hypothetical protein n=1 Tax=unclassified Bradyrhizobium TaxID=2631580 RepID=UPI0020B3BB75|nr:MULTISPECIES: hypothetical protein [unclassified Bradyrhizobium]MCP3402868.1 hypothetical protein [Bradyrhizobium sp. CCGB20]MCP3411346.1 hypothetical protein [Bradyrhizobium sp. CCGB01]